MLTNLICSADAKQTPTLFPKLQAHGPRAATLLEAEMVRGVPADALSKIRRNWRRGRQTLPQPAAVERGPEKAWLLLKHSPDPRARSYLIHRFTPLGVDPKRHHRAFGRGKRGVDQAGAVVGLGRIR